MNGDKEGSGTHVGSGSGARRGSGKQQSLQRDRKKGEVMFSAGSSGNVGRSDARGAVQPAVASKEAIVREALPSLDVEALLRVSAQVSSLLKRDFLRGLPDELCVLVLSWMDRQSLLMVSTVSREWRRLALDNILWKKLCIRQYGNFLDRSMSGHLGSRWIRNYCLLRRTYFLKTERLVRNDAFEGDEANRSLTGLQFDSRKILSAYAQGWMKCHDPKTGKFLGQWKAHSDTVCAFNLVGSRLISCGYEETVKEWNVKTGRLVNVFSRDANVRCLCFVDDFDELCLERQKAHEASFHAAGDTEKKEFMEVGSDSRPLKSDAQSVRTHGKKKRQASPRRAKAGDPDKSAATSPASLGGLQDDVRDLAGGEVSREAQLDEHALNAYREERKRAGWTSDEDFRFYAFRFPAIRTQLLVEGTRGGEIHVVSLRSYNVLRTLEGHSDRVSCVKFVKGTRLLISSSWDRSLKAWDMSTGQCLRTFLGHPGGITCFDYDGVRLVSAGYPRVVCVWDVESGNLLHLMDSATPLVIEMQCFGSLLVTIHPQRQVIVTEIDDARVVRTLEVEEGVPSCLMFDDSRLLVGTMSGRVVCWRAAPPALTERLPGMHEHGPYGLHSTDVFHPHPHLPPAVHASQAGRRIMARRNAEDGVVRHVEPRNDALAQRRFSM